MGLMFDFAVVLDPKLLVWTCFLSDLTVVGPEFDSEPLGSIDAVFEAGLNLLDVQAAFYGSGMC